MTGFTVLMVATDCYARNTDEWSRETAHPTAGIATPTPLYFVILPIAVALVQLALGGPLTEFSRNGTIRNSASLIADIERYCARLY